MATGAARRLFARPGTHIGQLLPPVTKLARYFYPLASAGPAGVLALNEQIMAGQYPGIVKTKLDGVNQIDYLTGKSEKSARDYFFYYSGSTPSAVRYKNWKMYYKIAEGGAAGWLQPLTTWHFPLIQNIKRDPFEQNVSPTDTKSLLFFGGSLAAPSTAYMYDGLAMFPLGQQLWLKELVARFNQFERI